jgi:DNA-binding XRE family transcriptional regulator
MTHQIYINKYSIFAIITTLLNLLILAALIVLAGYICVLLIKALKKYLRSNEVRKENAAVCKSLGDALKENRIRCKMTQEFVAEHMGVSRQAVSKWENGTSDPSTSNLLALAKLFGITAEELLESIRE